MDTVRVCLVDAFTDEPLTGNPAGVVPRADGLTDDQCLAIARELAVSETAFVFESTDADYRLRYFTPTEEVPFCGHATLGTIVHLHEQGRVADRTTIETGAGTREVEIEIEIESESETESETGSESNADRTIWMDQGAPTVREVDVQYGRVARALGIEQEILEGPKAELPMAVASTGLPFLIVPVTYLSALGSMTPDPEQIEAVTSAVDADGLYCFTFDTLDSESTLHGRAFAPAIGITEDPVTGTASGAVTAYLEHVGAFESPPDRYRFEQGHFVDRPGVVYAEGGSSVRVGGNGIPVLDGSVVVPDSEPDDIIEV